MSPVSVALQRCSRRADTLTARVVEVWSLTPGFPLFMLANYERFHGIIIISNATANYKEMETMYWLHYTKLSVFLGEGVCSHIEK